MKPAADILRTDRLVLRRVTTNDAQLLLAIWNDPAFIQYVGDRGIRTEDDALRAMQEGALKLWSESGFGPYGVFEAGTRQGMGVCGLFQRENLDAPDIGYGFLPAGRGRGFALEAAAAVRDHAREAMGLKRICAIVTPDHNRSIRLLEKLGMTREGAVRMPDEDEDLLLYGLVFERSDPGVQ